MDNAFDLKNLAERLSTPSKPVLEAEAKVLFEQTAGWLEESFALTPNKLDDLGIAGIEAIKPFVMSQLDKIDGQ